MRAIRSLLFIVSLAYVSVTRTYRGAIIACHRRMCAYICEAGAIHSSHTVFHHRAYIRIYPNTLLCHYCVIIVSYVKCDYVLMGYYVSIKRIMNTQEKRLDISTFVYVAIMITAFTFGVL